MLFAGEDITGKPRHEIARRGIARTFQNIRLFKEISVLENVLVGCHLRLDANLFEATLHPPSYRRRSGGEGVRARASRGGARVQRGRARHEPALRQAAAPRDRARSPRARRCSSSTSRRPA